MRGLRTQLHKEFQGQFITIKYKTLSNDEIKDYNGKGKVVKPRYHHRLRLTSLQNIS